jgi:hypothetical protein
MNSLNNIPVANLSELTQNSITKTSFAAGTKEE